MKSTIEKIVIAVLVCVGAYMLYNNYNSKHETLETVETAKIESKIISIREVAEDTVQIKMCIDWQ